MSRYNWNEANEKRIIDDQMKKCVPEFKASLITQSRVSIASPIIIIITTITNHIIITVVIIHIIITHQKKSLFNRSAPTAKI